jgi:hypothetical protein
MDYNISELIKSAHIDKEKLDVEVMFNSGYSAFIASELHKAETKYEEGSIKLESLEGQTSERLSSILKEELGKVPTGPQLKARLDQDETISTRRTQVVKRKTEAAMLRRLLAIYDRRFNMLQTSSATFRTEMENLKTGI